MAKEPVRTCCACRNRNEKAKLLRVARTKQGEYRIDKEQSLQGRGAYICKTPECVKTAVKKHTFERSFRSKVPSELYMQLEKEIL